MVSALCGVHAAKCSGTAHSSASNSEQSRFEFIHSEVDTGGATVFTIILTHTKLRGTYENYWI